LLLPIFEIDIAPMKKPFLFCLIFHVVSGLTAQVLPYKNAGLSPEARTRDLLSRMSFEEKLGQLQCYMGWDSYEKVDGVVRLSDLFKDRMRGNPPGALWGVFRADPWTKKTLITGLNPVSAAELSNAIQKYAIEETRLGIPVFLAEESPHGHMAIGTTVFPTGIGQAATWNPELLEEAWRIMAKEVRAQGAHIAYGPVLDLARDPRWSRVEETFGEDPVLTAILGTAAVKGAGGGQVGHKEAVISTLKHFVAYGVSEGGHNGSAVNVGPIDLHQNFLYPFRAAVKAGALSVMTGYNSVDGIPCTSDAVLLKDVLREKWGFEGFVVSDLFSINGLWTAHGVNSNLEDAATAALKAGVDMDLGASAYAKLSPNLLLDEAVARILRLKFRMGLFENPYVDPQEVKGAVRTPQHREVALEVARQSITLLENKQGILPLGNTEMKIAVVGPNANTMYNQLGDYTAPQSEDEVITVYEGIKKIFPRAKVNYSKGVAIRDSSDHGWEAAMELASTSDLIVAVVGGSSARDFKTVYKETGAAEAVAQGLADMENGEGFDRATLHLMGRQLDFLKALKATGKKLVVVYIQGRPLDMRWAREHADALLCAWYPGAYGGEALAEVLSGKVNPSGRLPISVPRDVGQLPVYYNKKKPLGGDYVEMSAKPLYPFGYGLSYTEFTYSDPQVGTFGLKFRLKNKGKRAGHEVVQVYFSPKHNPVAQPGRQLKHFQKVYLNPGEEKWITVPFVEEDFKTVDRDLKWTKSSKEFDIFVGASSDDIRLTVAWQ
jgi:beta-glucosidase